ncbi:hypothetical protein LLG90_02415 [Aromatoleum toluclasticum]|uniref:hypothetical protein n=1 Tax=Aromatoleum toluclasticum TaxID=92003 RepID=UPI001D193C80|nr:hypothetical protein [Aromatoleum toluclasticum]MCC4114197.1 hypothetical protein [Aromatoleum toluclasticum]
MTTHTQAHQVRHEDLPRGISAIRVLRQDDVAPMWGSIIVAEDNKERLPSQAILNFALRPKASLCDCVPQRLPDVDWSASVCGLEEVLHG